MFLKFFSALAAVLVCAGLFSELGTSSESPMRQEENRPVLTDIVRNEGISAINQTEPPVQSKITIHLTRSEAEQAALDHALLQAHEVVFSRTEYDIEGGVPEWEIEFRCGDYEYDYIVHAENGKILEYERDYEPAQQTAQKPQTASPQAESQPQASSSAEVTKEQAIEIALVHAGLHADEVQGLQAKRDRDNGVMTYEIEFRRGRVEYEYEIHAENGKILDWDMDTDN